jgi:hypothetical protein
MVPVLLPPGNLGSFAPLLEPPGSAGTATHTPTMCRLPTTTIALALALVLGLPAGALAAAEGATIDKTGWWGRANSATSTPAGPVTVPPPPGVPEGDLAVGRIGSEPSAIAAVGIQPDDGPGATVESFVLTLREDPDARGNQSTEDAAIVACPITSFWTGGENGTWDTRPEYDCAAASAPGVRSDDGTWTFDLAAVGALWFDTFGTIRADGVALVPDDTGDGSFQVVWQGGDTIDVELRSEPGGTREDPFASPSSDPPADAGLSSGPGGGGSSILSPPRVTTPPTVATPPAVPAPPAVSDAAPDAAEDEVAGAPVSTETPPASRAGTLIGNLPAAGLLLVPFALATMFAMSYWLGPAGQPSTIDRRGGVSRALALRARTAQER